MNPKYTFYLQGVQAFPVYGDAVAVNFDKDSGQEYFRPKWSGKVTFIGADYATIMAASFATKFTFRVDLTWGGTTSTIFTGHFYKTDCEFDEAGQTVVVTPTADDAYNAILAGMDKEFNLVKLAPAIQAISIAKRPVVQIYNRGDDEITCILGGMWWTQPCTAEDGPGPLVSTYNFKHISTGIINAYSIFNPSGDWTDAPGIVANCYTRVGGSWYGTTAAKNGFYVYFENYSTSHFRVLIRREDDDTMEWTSGLLPHGDLVNPMEITMTGSDPSYPTLTMAVRRIDIYARVVTDATSILGVPTRVLPSPDITENTQNYAYCAPYDVADEVHLEEDMEVNPTDLGQWDNGMYYKQWYPLTGRPIPICRNGWDGFSLWFGWDSSGNFDQLIEEDGRASFLLRDAYPLWSVIQVLLNEVGAGVTFQPDTDHSEFFFSELPNRRDATYQVFITPKTNILTSDYEEAAQRGDISLKMVFDLLRDCFRCYWFIDSGKLRIEHIRYFMNGRSYTGSPGVGVDMTDMTYTRSGKTAATGQEKYKYDKPDTYSRIQFGWMDAETEPFNGIPVDIVADWIEENRVNEVQVSQFSSDVDWLLANPEEASKDGFVLLLAIPDGDGYKLPFIEGNYPDEFWQNGYATFQWLFGYYRYDLPAPNYKRGNTPGTAANTKQLKVQEVTFPAAWMPDLYSLIKTNLGSGAIRSLSIQLLDPTCKATLTYGTT